VADTDSAIHYAPNTYPALPGGEALYLVEELGRLQDTVASLIAVLELLEARIVVLEP
jgi:hypothetical protein